MSFSVYDAIYNGEQLINKVIANAMKSVSEEIKKLEEEWRELTTQFNDPYSWTLVLVSNNSSPLPNPEYVYLSREKMITIFDEVLGGSSLNNLYSILQKQHKNKLDMDALTKSVQQSSFYKEYSENVNARIQDKKDCIAASKKKASEATITEEEKEFAKVLNFDHYYSYSDDASVYRSGADRHEEVKKIVIKTLEEKPHLRKVLDVVAERYNLTAKFFM